LFTSEINKLGIRVGKKEINDILFGANPPDDMKRQFTDPATGQYNAAEAMRAFNEMKRKGTQEQKDNFNTYIDQLEYIRMVDKYNSLMNNSINYPKWLLEKQNADNSLLGKISFVKEVYSSIPDSSIKITDKEIADYISKNKDDYKQEETRSIAYVSFPATPSAADSLDQKQKLAALAAAFDSTKNVEQFLAGEGINNYYAGFVSSKRIQIANKDSIFKTPVGQVYGPYLEGGNYVLAKVEGEKMMPDTAKVRHILVATTQQDPQTGQMQVVRDSVSAKKTIDSIQKAIQNGSKFDSLVVQLSDDPGSKNKGGVYDSIPTGQMVPEFNDYIFGNPVGTKGVVKTQFGYHYIEILGQKGNNMAYKIAYLPKQIVASPETDAKALNDANLFAGDSRDQKSFEANYEKNLKPKGINKGIAPDIRPTDAQVRGLGLSREFVRNIYKAKKGEVLQPERVGDDYVVAVVTEVNSEGTQDVAKARTSVEPLLRNKKKAEMLKQKVGKVTTLEAASTALGKPIETADSVRMTSKSASASLGYEPRISGATFNPSNRGKVVPEALEGVNGIYVVRVDSVKTTAIANANVAEQRKQMYMNALQMAKYSSPVTALRAAATIKDRRAERF